MREMPGRRKKAAMKTSPECLVNRRIRRTGKLHKYLSFRQLGFLSGACQPRRPTAPKRLDWAPKMARFRMEFRVAQRAA
jgi:hypothetical protein